jgi:PEP-CTERM motif
MSVTCNPFARAACLVMALVGKRVVALAFGLGAFGLTSAAHATLILSISVNGGAPIVVQDNGVGDTNPAPNAITYSNAIVGFALSSITATTNDPGNSTSGFVSASQVLFQNTGNTPITVALTPSDTGFTSPTGTRRLESDLSASLVAPGVGDFASLVSTANATSTPIQTLTASGTNSVIIPFGDPGVYSLQNVTTARLSPGATDFLTSTTSVIVPEPASFGLLVLGALGLLARRRRR